MRNGISFVQVVFILMLSNGLINHVIIIPHLLDAAGRDAWISVLAILPLYLLLIGMIVFTQHVSGKEPILKWVQSQYGRGINWLLTSLLALYLFMIAVITIKDILIWVNLTFAPRIPMIILAVVFGAVCLINALFGIRSISMLSVFLLPVVVILGFFVMTTNFQYKDYSYLLPMLEFGWEPVVRGMVYAGTGFSEILLFLLLTPYIGPEVNFKKMALLGFIQVWLTLGPLIGAIAEFGPQEAAKLRFPAYEEWRLVKIGLYIEHVDFFSIYQWFSGAFIRVSLVLFLLGDLFRLPQSRGRVRFLVLISLLAIGSSLWPYNDIWFYQILSRYLLPGLLALSLFLSVTFTLLALFSRRKEQTDEQQSTPESL
ncbi:endospore germination permease [Brevibacillus composti]|uniref:Endospore germination permease n=1 Tax=Brevibacillus composti TaxID=2796470 RepID=A0A7T5JPJ2_9BACL|nr:endospore germination permease [Brevibacillus composti]QQE75150.1 endospore germination permease [Brevibacillus composti]QUO42238.1 endospore germination permease [Brevibacillus composti]